MVDTRGEVPQGWARRTAERLVEAILATCERHPAEDQEALLREIARRALRRMPNAAFEARELAKALEIESMKQP
jgi:hypothetical protein